MLTIKDLNEIEKVVDSKLDEKFKHVPTTNTFLGWMQKIMGELQAIRDSIDILNDRSTEHSDKLDDHDNRITKIERHFVQ